MCVRGFPPLSQSAIKKKKEKGISSRWLQKCLSFSPWVSWKKGGEAGSGAQGENHRRMLSRAHLIAV